MYHHYKKNSSYLREALYKAYDCKCVYCSETLELRHMHVDHILPTNKADINDEEVKQYIEELEKDGFIQDSIENYLPVCSACNLKKSNHVFKVSAMDLEIAKIRPFKDHPFKVLGKRYILSLISEKKIKMYLTAD